MVARIKWWPLDANGTYLAQFKRALAGLQEIYRKYLHGAVTKIKWRPLDASGTLADLGDEHRQRGFDGAPATTLDDLY